MRLTIEKINQIKETGEKIPMLTAYDFPTAKLLDSAGVPMILVGDSLGMVVLGYDSTVPVTMSDMLHHIKAVVRGTNRAFVVGDMPFMSYQASLSDAMRNAGRLLQEGGCQAVKLEGGQRVAATIQRIVESGIPVMGHLGLTPQSVNQFSGFRVQGKTPRAAVQLIQDAHALEEAGAFSIVLESVPAPLAKIITERVSIPTIGIGAGPYCDGQVQVLPDMLGLFTEFIPKHAKPYADLAEIISSAVSRYMTEVSSSAFPTAKESYGLKDAVAEELKQLV
ncbi:3-methyl-2-oxobutanoate hydroxymethyltransferase [Dehalococcoidia bacterium]|nr:3-methyl-2-oxobutanoate hydroxymethyltransferase [Dehalococcoidia bacterium]